jgi:hypothetical protein
MSNTLSPSPIVVYGAARSGTTYLVQLLDQHPEVHVTDESRVFSWAHQALRQLAIDGDTSGRERDAPGGTRVSARRAFVAFARRGIAQLVHDFYRQLAPDARWWGDKHPHYADPEQAGLLEDIVTLFPGTRFLHIVRDGRDVVTSGLRGVWTDFDAVHAMWTSHVERGASFGRSLPREQYFELRYEELVADDLAMARRIFDFLGIDMRPGVERFCLDQQRCRTPYCTPSRDIRSDVRRSDWAAHLDPAQRLRSLALIGDGLVRFGYETAESLAALRRRIAEEAAEPELATAGPLPGHRQPAVDGNPAGRSDRE